MRPDDQLAPEALFEMARCITRYSDTDVIFSDHDVIASDGEYVDPFFKPGWNPDLLLSINYLSLSASFAARCCWKVLRGKGFLEKMTCMRFSFKSLTVQGGSNTFRRYYVTHVQIPPPKRQCPAMGCGTGNPLRL